MDISPSHSNEYIRSYSTFDESNPGSRGDVDVNLLRMKYKQTENRVYHDFFKTKLCSLNNLSICKKGKACPFAHNVDEVRDKPNLYKTKLCDAFLVGECNRGEDCCFAHGETELRSTPDLFKTAICHLWTQGKCNAGDQCRFAHGDDDLRPAPSHQKFKRKNTSRKPLSQVKEFSSNMNYGQYPYAQNYYDSYQMYSMSMLPTDLQNNYMMNQPYMYNYGGAPMQK